MLSTLIAAHYGPVEDIEVVWTLIAFIGAIFSVYNVREARKDLHALSTIDKNNGRGKLGRFAIKTEVARLAIQLIFLLIGVLAMSVQSRGTPAGTPWNIVLLGIIFRWGLIIASLLVTLKSYWGYKIRKDLREGLTHDVLAGLDEHDNLTLSGHVELKVDGAATSPDSV